MHSNESEKKLVLVTSRLKKSKSSEKIVSCEPMFVKNTKKVHKKQLASLSKVMDVDQTDSLVSLDLREQMKKF